MVIKRKGNDFGLTTEVIEIELTPQELEHPTINVMNLHFSCMSILDL